MNPHCLLPHSQLPSACPFPEPSQYSPCTPFPLLKFNFNIIPSSIPGSSKWSISLTLPQQYYICTSPPPIRAKWPAQFLLLDLITRKIFGDIYRTLSSSLCSFLHLAVTSNLLEQNTLPSPLFSNTLKHVPPLTWGKNFTTNKTNGTFIVLHVFIFPFFERKAGRQNILHRMIASVPWL